MKKSLLLCIILIILIMLGGCSMGHEHVYGICENKCMVEVPTKAETDDNFNDVNDKINEAMTYSETPSKIGTLEGNPVYRIAYNTDISDWTFDSTNQIYTLTISKQFDIDSILNATISIRSGVKTLFVLPTEIGISSNLVIKFKKPDDISSVNFPIIVIDFVVWIDDD